MVTRSSETAGMSAEAPLTGLQMRALEGQEDLEKHQLCFVVYQGARKVAWTGEWSCMESCQAPAATSNGGGPMASHLVPPNLISATMSLVQAPKCFSEPITQRKPMKPAFKVRLELKYKSNLQLPIRLEACSLSEPAVEQLLKLHSEGGALAGLPGLSRHQELEHSSISLCIQTLDGQTHSNGTRRHVEDFEFTDMRFSKSSRMHQRWILFSCRLGVDALHLLYKLPTIVLSRKTDQFEKACAILMTKDHMRTNLWSRPSSGQLPDTSIPNNVHGNTKVMDAALGGAGRLQLNDGAVPSGELGIPEPEERIRKWVIEKYDETKFTRKLTKYDMMYLVARASSNCFQSGQMPSENFEKSHQWADFQHWFLMCLKSLQQEEHLWNAQDYMKICDLMVDRTIAEDLLAEEPVGTFIVRLCSEPGAFALSIKVESTEDEPAEIEHYLVDALDLRQQGLEEWIAAHHQAMMFLEVKSGNQIPKSVVFPSRGITRCCTQGNTTSQKGINGPLIRALRTPVVEGMIIPGHVCENGARAEPFPQRAEIGQKTTGPLPDGQNCCSQPTSSAPGQSLLMSQPSVSVLQSVRSRLCEGRNIPYVPQESTRPQTPTRDQLLKLAAECGFDVSHGLDEIMHPIAGTPKSMQQMSELAQFCGIDVSLLLEPAKMNNRRRVLFGASTDTLTARPKRSAPNAVSPESRSKLSRMGSH